MLCVDLSCVAAESGVVNRWALCCGMSSISLTGLSDCRMPSFLFLLLSFSATDSTGELSVAVVTLLYVTDAHESTAL